MWGWNKNERDVSLVFSNSEILDSSQLHWGFLLRISDRGGVGHGSSGVLVFLQKDLSKDDIIKILELDGEDDDASI